MASVILCSFSALGWHLYTTRHVRLTVRYEEIGLSLAVLSCSWFRTTLRFKFRDLMHVLEQSIYMTAHWMDTRVSDSTVRAFASVRAWIRCWPASYSATWPLLESSFEGGRVWRVFRCVDDFQVLYKSNSDIKAQLSASDFRNIYFRPCRFYMVTKESVENNHIHFLDPCLVIYPDHVSWGYALLAEKVFLP